MTTKARRPDGGYFVIPNRWVTAGYMQQAPGAITQVYVFLSRWANNETGETAQPIRLVALKCGLTEDYARKAIRTLEAWGVITLEAHKDDKGHNVWTLNHLLPEAPPYPNKVGGPEKVRAPRKSGPEKVRALNNLSNHQPEEIEQPDSVRTTPAWEQRFNRWYSTYPRKQAKGDAKKAWQKINPDDALVAEMVAAVERQKRTQDWQKDGGKYIPLPASWLRAERWLDEVGDVAPSTPQRQPTYANSVDPYEAQLLAGLEGEE